MATDIAAKKMTAEEFFDFVHKPENADKWFELVKGEVIELPPPFRKHGIVTNNIGRILGTYTFQVDKGYVASNDSGVILERDPDTVRGPDVAVYEDAESFAEVHPKYGEVPPRLAVEVLSPSDRADRVVHKINEYLRNGVAVVWLADPETRTVIVYRLDTGPRELGEDDEITAAEIMPGFRCSVAEFFRVPGQADKPKDQPSS